MNELMNWHENEKQTPQEIQDIYLQHVFHM